MPIKLSEYQDQSIHTVIKFKIQLDNKIFSSPAFQRMPSYKGLRNVLGITENIRIYCKYADSQSYFLLSKHVMPDLSTDFVLRLSKTSPPASPEGI